MISSAFTNGAFNDMELVMLEVHEEEGKLWVSCPFCPGFSAAADTREDLVRLASEFHQSADATHPDWWFVWLSEVEQ